MNELTDIWPLTSYVGAEVSGVDLKGLDEVTFQAIRGMFLKHQVLFLEIKLFHRKIW